MARFNLIPNPSFRQGMVGYRPTGGAQLSVYNGPSFYGLESLEITKSNQNNSGVVLDPIPVTAGLNYAFSAYVRVPVTIPSTEAANLVMKVSWISATGAILSDSVSTAIRVNPLDSWVRLTGVSSAPYGTVSAQISVIQLAAGSANQRFYLDALLFEQSSFVGGYLDNLPQADETHIVNKGLAALPAPITGGLELQADIILGNMVLNTIDEFNVAWICTNIDGWWGNVEPEAPNIARGVEDGDYDVSGRYKARNITVTGSFLLPDPSALGATRDRLVTALNIIRKGVWFRTAENPTRAAFVRISGKPQIQTVNARGRTDFSISLKAADPIRYVWNDSDPNGLMTSIIETNLQARATNLATDPSFEDVVGGTVVVSRNLVANPDSSTGVGWLTASVGIGGTTNAGMISGAGESGSFGYVNTWTTAITGGSVIILNGGYVGATQTKVTAGSYISASMWVKMSLAKSGYTFSMSFLSGAGVSVGLISSSPESFNANEGKTVKIENVLVPNGAEYMQLMLSSFDAGPMPVGAQITTSSPMVVASQSIEKFFSGNSLAVGDYTYDWEGTVNSSPSRRLAPRLSMVPAATSTGVVAQSSSWATRDGRKSARFVSKRLSTTPNSFDAVTFTGPTAQDMSGKTYTALVSVRLEAPLVSVGPDSLKLKIRWTLSDGTSNQVSSASAPNTAGIHELRVTARIPALSVTSVSVTCDHSASGESWWDDLLLAEVPGLDTPYTSTYFDGGLPDSDYFTYTWSGVANKSTSLRSPTRTAVGYLNNIGNADVTAVFDLVGPLGAKSVIRNSSNGESLTTAVELRGAGIAATVRAVSLLKNIVTLTIMKPGYVQVGDRISVAGLGAPYDSVNESFTVTSVSNFAPYTISYSRVSADMDEVLRTGYVSLVDNDVMSIDTYKRSVTYNGNSIGQRSKIQTLVDWIKLTSGENVITYTDNPTRLISVTKALANNVATITTMEPHFFQPGEYVVVDLQTTAALAKKALTNNVVTLTTAEDHGMSLGDVIDVQTTEQSVVTNKVVNSNVVTLTTAVLGSFAIGDVIQVSLPKEAGISGKSATGNVVTITTTNTHNYSIGDSVTITMPVSASITAKGLLNGQATLTSSNHGFSLGDSVTVTFPTSASIINKYTSGSSVVMTTQAAHGFSVGDLITVSLPTVADLALPRSMAGATSYLVTINTQAAHGFDVGDRVAVDVGVAPTVTLSGRSGTATTATLTSNLHRFSVGETVEVSGLESRYNGTNVITAVTANTFSYASPGVVETITGSGGSATNTTILNGYNGNKVIQTIPTSTSFTYLYYAQQDPITSSAVPNSGTTAIINNTNSSLNGTFSVTSTTNTTLTYTR